MGEAKYNAILCEGAAEEAVIDILLENSAIKINSDQFLINKGPISERKAEDFCNKYLGAEFEGKVNVYRIIDSKSDKFNFKTKRLRSIYEEKIILHDIYTSPEIEMLVIHSEKKYLQFSKSKKKPSDFCKEDLGFKNVKYYDFVYSYFSEFEKLIESIKEYKRMSKIKKSEKTLYDLLKDDYK